MKKILVVSYFLLIGLNLYDIISTYTLMSLDLATEANPFMNWLMSILGVLPAMICFKGTFLSLLGFTFYKAYKKKTLTIRESCFIYGGTFILISYYLYFMITRNLQYLLIS